MSLAKVQRGLDIGSLLILLSANTFSLHNSFELFHFQYSRQQLLREEVENQFAFLTNNYQQSAYWFYMNLNLGCTLLSELCLFIIIAFKAARTKATGYYITAASIIVFQLILTMQNLWPFSGFSEYGQGFSTRKSQALEICEFDGGSYSCKFTATLLYTISSSKIFVIVTFLSLAALSASNMLGQTHQEGLKQRISTLAEKIRQKQEIENGQEEDKITTQLIKEKKNQLKETKSKKNKNSAGIKKENQSDKIATISKIDPKVKIVTVGAEKAEEQADLASLLWSEKVKEGDQGQAVKKPSKIRRPSFWSTSFSRVTQATSSSPSIESSFMEDAQASDVDNSWQPSYITFTPKPKKVTPPKMSCDSSFSTIGESSTRLANPQIGLFGHFLDKSVDQIEIDIQENKQL